MMNLADFLIKQPNEIGFIVGNVSDLTELGYAGKINSDLIPINMFDSKIRFIRGEYAKDLKSFFSEISAVLQLPYNFGNNWSALEDVLLHIDEFVGDGRILLVFTNVSVILINQIEEWINFLQVLDVVMLEMSAANFCLNIIFQDASFKVLNKIQTELNIYNRSFFEICYRN